MSSPSIQRTLPALLRAAPLKIHYAVRWEDGQPVKATIDAPNRWQVQAAEKLTVKLQPGVSITLQQQVCLQAPALSCMLPSTKTCNGWTPLHCPMLSTNMLQLACVWQGSRCFVPILLMQPCSSACTAALQAPAALWTLQTSSYQVRLPDVVHSQYTHTACMLGASGSLPELISSIAD